MSHTFQLSEEQYAYLEAYSQAIGETPETFFQYWIEGVVDRMQAHKTVLRKRTEEQTRKSHEERPLDLLLKDPTADTETLTSKKEGNV
jgi:hypothetical protein